MLFLTEMRNTFIGFAVYSDVDSLYMDRDDRMIFNNVAFNSGNGYDANTGNVIYSIFAMFRSTPKYQYESVIIRSGVISEHGPKVWSFS